MRSGLCILLALVAAASIAGCAASSNLMSAGPSNLRPTVLQSNAPSPSSWQSEPAIAGMPVLGPDGSSIWVAGVGVGSSATRLDIATNTARSFSLSGSVNHSHAGPDGNLWFCGQRQVGKISSSGVVTYYSEPIGNCFGITTGPDNNLWLTDQTSIDRVTTAGQLSSFSLQVVGLGNIASSSRDGVLWFEYENWSGFGLGTFDPTTDKYTLFPSGSNASFGGLDTGVDGNAYLVPTLDGRSDGQIIQFSTQGRVRRFNHLPKTRGYDNNGENVYTIWFGGRDGHLYGWTTQGHKLVDKGVAPFVVDYPVLGPDMNIWYESGVYLQRVLTVIPQSATVGVGGQQTFAISETDCPVCIWSAVSSDPSIAQVSPVSGGAFTVTGESLGSATVTVSDKRNNVVQVPITVQ